MRRERLMALFIGSIMLMSIIGFSLSNAKFGNTQQNTIDFPFKIERQLSTEELVSVLRAGRIVVEHTYEENCTDCLETNAFLDTFFNQFRNYVVLQIMEGNETSLKIIGSGGRIRDLSEIELNNDNMLDVFCELAIAQPRECLLEQI